MARRSIHALAAFLLFLPGCATTPSTAGTESPTTATTSAEARADETMIRVEVNHDRTNGGTATIYLQPAGGVRSTLGTISYGERKTFPYRVESANRSITLSAIDASGQTITSRQITVPRGAGVVWNLQINSVTVRRGG